MESISYILLPFICLFFIGTIKRDVNYWEGFKRIAICSLMISIPAALALIGTLIEFNKTGRGETVSVVIWLGIAILPMVILALGWILEGFKQQR